MRQPPRASRERGALFQEYDLDAPDTTEHATLVMERVLAYGDRREFRWLFSLYGRPRILQWVREFPGVVTTCGACCWICRRLAGRVRRKAAYGRIESGALDSGRPQHTRPALMVVESLILFENADPDLQPDRRVDLAWAVVRQFFIDQAKALGRSWLY
jgi:hypothetical protein